MNVGSGIVIFMVIWSIIVVLEDKLEKKWFP